MAQDALSFERDIRPLFRERDVSSMAGRFNLASYTDVSAHSDRILSRLADGSMPCDGSWPTEQIDLFRRWIDAGRPA